MPKAVTASSSVDTASKRRLMLAAAAPSCKYLARALRALVRGQLKFSFSPGRGHSNEISLPLDDNVT